MLFSFSHLILLLRSKQFATVRTKLAGLITEKDWMDPAETDESVVARSYCTSVRTKFKLSTVEKTDPQTDPLKVKVRTWYGRHGIPRE